MALIKANWLGVCLTMNKKAEEKLSFREKMKDKKYSAKVQLIGYGIFIVIIIIYANVSNRNYNYNYDNTVTNTKTTTSNTMESTTKESLLDTIDKNYDYQISVEITKNSGEVSNYQYTGSSCEETFKIITNNQIFYLKNNEYYKEEEGIYTLVEEKDVYEELEEKYINLEEIKNYLEKSSLDHTTNYSSGETISTYYLYLKDILPSYYEEDYVEFNIRELEGTLNIEIDYSNLMNYKDQEIQNYKVTSTYTNIGTVESFDIETN